MGVGEGGELRSEYLGCHLSIETACLVHVSMTAGLGQESVPRGGGQKTHLSPHLCFHLGSCRHSLQIHFLPGPCQLLGRSYHTICEDEEEGG